MSSCKPEQSVLKCHVWKYLQYWLRLQFYNFLVCAAFIYSWILRSNMVWKNFQLFDKLLNVQNSWTHILCPTLNEFTWDVRPTLASLTVYILLAHKDISIYQFYLEAFQSLAWRPQQSCPKSWHPDDWLRASLGILPLLCFPGARIDGCYCCCRAILRNVNSSDTKLSTKP